MRPGDSELTDSVLNDIIGLCETDAFRRLDLSDTETRDAAFAVSAEYTALPTGFKGFRRDPRVNGTTNYRLQLASPSEIDDECDHGSTGSPRYYCIEANQLRVGQSPASALTLDITYYGTPAPITDSGAQNFLLTSAPDLYLFGSLAHSAPFIGEDGRMTLWQTKYEQAIATLKSANVRKKWSGGPAEMRIPGGTP